MGCLPWSCELTVESYEIFFGIKYPDMFVVGVSGPSDLLLWYLEVFSNRLCGGEFGSACIIPSPVCVSYMVHRPRLGPCLFDVILFYMIELLFFVRGYSEFDEGITFSSYISF